MENESKITVYVAFGDEGKRRDLEMAVMTAFQDIAVFPLTSKSEFDQRLIKNPPHMVLTDANFLQGNTILKDGVTRPERTFTSFIVFGSVPNKEEFLDEIMMSKIQFFEEEAEEAELNAALKKAMKFSLESKSAAFLMKQLKAGEYLMKVGDKASQVYILKKGKLQAYSTNPQGAKTILGEVTPGEFVGEMAYFNSDPRSASVVALTDAELVEIPIASFERVLYQKPAWAMKLVETLSKRLKKFLQKA